MNEDSRAFLESLLQTPRPSGYEAAAQRVWVDRVSEFADSVETDAYGNAVARVEGDGPTIAVVGHADQIGLLVRRIDEDGYLHPEAVGGWDKTVSKGQYVTVHADDESVPGVVGQTAIHVRDRDDETIADTGEQRIDIGADDEDAARELVAVGDPITVDAPPTALEGTRLASRGLDNRVGVWTAAAVLEQVANSPVDAEVCAVSTVQEELGIKGAQMVGFDLDPGAAIAVDVTHASDTPEAGADKTGDVSLGDGPTIARGSASHPALVDLARDAADRADVDVQLTAAGSRTGTDADGIYVQRGGIPSLRIGIPNRYMHTPVEVVDTEDCDSCVALLTAMADRAAERAPFAVDV
jgi:putative aminopeptidase FrvX